jgi:type I restriction enzyme S subunit
MSEMIEELIGPVPEGWEYKTLGRVCKEGGGDIQTGPFGSQLHASDYVQAGIPSIMPQNIGDNRIVEDGIARITPLDASRLSRYLVRKGDIVYSRRGDVERRALVREHEDGWLCGTGCLRVRLGDRGPDPRYASYYLGHPSVREWIVRHAHGATMPNLNTSILGACPFVVPPPAEQHAIAHILGTLDDKIELNRKQNETLEAMARALFKAWFVDFEPVRAKIEGRWQRGQSLPGLPAYLYDLFPDRLVESELGEIPEGWEVQPLSELLTIIGGGTPKTSVKEYWDGDIPWFSVVDTPPASDVFVVSTEKTITSQGLAGSSARLIPKGTTIISARGTVGNLAIAGREMTFNQSCYGLRGNGYAGDYFVYLTAKKMVDQLKSMAHGSVFSTITRQTFEAIKRPVPPLPVLEAFEGLVTVWFEAILSNVEASRTLAQLRDTLLPKLISGELRVKDAEAFLKERGL